MMPCGEGGGTAGLFLQILAYPDNSVVALNNSRQNYRNQLDVSLGLLVPASLVRGKVLSRCMERFCEISAQNMLLEHSMSNLE